jgi:DNA-binding NtrC family response regulator
MEPQNSALALHVLLVEDNEHDALAFRRAFHKSQVAAQVAICRRAEEALEQVRADPAAFDVVVSDHRLPGMSGLELCLELLARELGVPLVILTGAGTERLAVQALKSGVDDYLIKDVAGGYLELLPVVLPAVVQQYRDRLARQRAEAERERLIGELQEALAKIKTLRGLLPICAACKKIRDDQGYWTQVEVYVREHTEAEFSHSICPDCAVKFYPELYEEQEGVPEANP